MRFTYPHEAHMAKAYLESEGFSVMIRDELTAQVNNFYSGAIGGVKLLVQESVYDECVKTLKNGGYLIADDQENTFKIEKVKLISKAQMKKCPFCGSEEIGKNSELNVIAVFFLIILGALFPIFKSTYKCFDCFKNWKFVK
jgi:hypothetical protein